MIELGHLHKDPGLEQLLITAARNTFYLPGAQPRSGRTSTPPFGSSAVKLATLDRDRSLLADLSRLIVTVATVHSADLSKLTKASHSYRGHVFNKITLIISTQDGTRMLSMH